MASTRPAVGNPPAHGLGAAERSPPECALGWRVREVLGRVGLAGSKGAGAEMAEVRGRVSHGTR